MKNVKVTLKYMSRTDKTSYENWLNCIILTVKAYHYFYRKYTEPFISCFHVLTSNTSFQYLSIHAMSFIACFNYIAEKGDFGPMLQLYWVFYTTNMDEHNMHQRKNVKRFKEYSGVCTNHRKSPKVQKVKNLIYGKSSTI